MKSKRLRNSQGIVLRSYPVGVLLVGIVWGMGLARLLAEQCGVAIFQVSWLPVVGLAVLCAAILCVAWRWALHDSWDWCALLSLLLPVLYVVGAVDTPLG